MEEKQDTTQETSSTAGSSDTSFATTSEEQLHPKNRVVSRHRRLLQRIKHDSAANKRHKVPTESASSQRSPEEWASKMGRGIKETALNRTPGEWLETLLPMYSWLKTYKWKSQLPNDILAGLSVGVMVVPQSMAYAKLAGLPVEYGLYSALVPVYAYALFGTSRQLAVGPVALISLLLATGINLVLESEGITPDNTEDYTQRYNILAVQIAFLVGVINIAMGLLRLGFVTIFLSHAVISGFTTGAAVIIGMSQLKYILGYEVERSDRLIPLLVNTFKNIDQFNWKTFLMGSLSILALCLLKYVGKNYDKFKWVRAMGPLLVTFVTIVLTVAFDLDQKGIPIVGTIPKGLPSFTANLWVPIGYDLGKVFLTVISIVIVGFMESIAIAKQLASKHKYEIDSSKELIGLGMSNFLGAMFQSYPVTGSFSRSAVNNESGAQSGFSGIMTATLVGFVLLLLTAVFEKMPLATLAAIVISGVIGLLDYEEAMYLWRVHKFDFWVWTIACLGTMFLGVEIGLAIAVCVSLLLVIYESAYPHTAVLGRLPGTTVYRNVKQYPEAERYDGIVIVRVDAPFYFANTQNVREKLQKYEQNAEEQLKEKDHVRFIILDMSPVSHVDTSALHILQDMHESYRERGIQLCFSNPNLKVMQRFRTSGLYDAIGHEHFFVSLDDAVHWCLEHMDLAFHSQSMLSIYSQDDMVSLGEESDLQSEQSGLVPLEEEPNTMVDP